MMSPSVNIPLFLAVLSFSSCAVPQRDEYDQPRVTEQEIAEIKPLINKELYRSGATITAFHRVGPNTIEVWTYLGIYKVRGSDGEWKIVEKPLGEL